MRVSVIIPCYNSEAFVERAVNSVLAQTNTDLELLLVDNNSTDNTISVLKRFEQQYPEKIRVLYEKEAGAPFARNLGLKESSGVWVQFLDADDSIFPDKLENQIKFINKYNPDVVVDDYVQTRKDGTTTTIVAEDNIWVGLINSKLGLTSSCLWRRESLLNVGGWEKSLTSSQEYELMFRLLKANSKIVVTHTISAQTFLQPESVSQSENKTKLRKVILTRIKLRYEIQHYLRKKSLLTKEFNTAMATYIAKQILILKQDVQFLNEQFNILFSAVPFSIRVFLYYRYILFYLESSFPDKSIGVRKWMLPWFLLTKANRLFKA